MVIRKIYFGLLFISQCFSLQATNYYVNNAVGKDANKGTSPANAWKSIVPFAGIELQAGDSLLFATGQHFTGMLSIVNAKGLLYRPIVICSYEYRGNKAKPVLDAGRELNAVLIRNSSFVQVSDIEITAAVPYQSTGLSTKAEMRCGILVDITKEEAFENIELSHLTVHDVYYNAPGFTRAAAETKSANGTQSYGWGIRVINNTKAGKLTGLKIVKAEVFRVCHTGVKITAAANGIQQVEVADCKVYQTGGPGMQFSGVTNGHIHHNRIDHSGSTADTRNWGRGSGLWTWACSNILIEYNRFENANGPGDSAGVHIDYNCNDVVVQYNLSANNAGGFCEILGNNNNCAYRYNISVNDGYRVKGINGAFQEGKVFWLSGYQGNDKKSAGPYNSYFYNNSIYVSAGIVPKIAISSSADGVLIENNIFCFEGEAKMVAGDQKKNEHDLDGVPNAIFKNNLFLRADNWPADCPLQDTAPLTGDPGFKNKGGILERDYSPSNKKLVQNRGIAVVPIPQDSIGLRIGLKLTKDILGNPITGQPDLGAVELNDNDR